MRIVLNLIISCFTAQTTAPVRPDVDNPVVCEYVFYCLMLSCFCCRLDIEVKKIQILSIKVDIVFAADRSIKSISDNKTICLHAHIGLQIMTYYINKLGNKVYLFFEIFLFISPSVPSSAAQVVSRLKIMSTI